MESRVEKGRKRAKVEEGSTVKIKRAKGKAQLKVTNFNSTALIEPKLKWKPIKMSTPPQAAQFQEQPSLAELKPRIWTSSREELVVLLPELAGPKCLNGVSWLMYETPMVLLDESNSTACFDISLQEDSITLDLLTTREFTCTWPPKPENSPEPPEQLTVNDTSDGNGLNWITSSSKGAPKTRRPKKSAPTVLTGGSKVSIPSPTCTLPREPSLPVESVSKSSETNTKVLYGSGGRMEEAAGSGKEMPERASIGFPPSVPSRSFGSFGELLRDNTATKYQHEGSSSSIRLRDPATKIREQNHFTNALMFTDPGQVVNGGGNIGHQSQGRVELADNQPPTFCPCCLPHCSSPYEPRYIVFADASFTTPEAIDNFLIQACNSPSLYNMEPDILNSNTRTTAITVDHTQLASANIGSHGIQNASSPSMKWVPPSAAPNYPIAVSNNQMGPDLNKFPSSDPSEAKVKQIRDVNQDTFIPSTLPEEVQAIIDSYLSGQPVLLISSNKRLFDCWSLRLPQEFGYSMLGYFRILGVQESRVLPDDPEPPLKDHSGLLTGRVTWRFRLQWSPGGEEWILPNHDKNLLEHPWWKPPPPPSIPLDLQISSVDARSTIINSGAPGVSQEVPGVPGVPFEPEDTTPRYRVARLSNVNYKFRHDHLGARYHSLVPLTFLVRDGRTVLDSSFPRGWLCKGCGKMNFQAALRHRMCSSSFCKGLEPEIAPYAIELILMRNPEDTLSMIFPHNKPLLINLVDTWEDGTRTLPYYIHDDKNIFIKHIFTRNLPLLQVEATRLLHFIQLEVELVRPIGENSPYFQYAAHAPKDDPSPTTSQWPNVPLSIHHAKDWTRHQAIWFGELKEEQLSINHLCLLAWVSSGTKRGPATIRAKDKCVLFHAFGCDITVMVTPLSSKTVKTEGVDIDSLNLITMDDLPPDEPDRLSGWIADLDEDNDAVDHHSEDNDAVDHSSEDNDAVDHPSQEGRESATITKKASNSKCPFLFTLVHGDVLVFYGDDFEYSLKRAGTSINYLSPERTLGMIRSWLEPCSMRLLETWQK